MSNISSIDDLLMGVGNSQQPATPEHKDKIEKAKIEEAEKEPNDDNVEVEYESDPVSDDDEGDEPESQEDDEGDEKSQKKSESQDEDMDEEDEYGNKKERMSKGMKDRLDRKEKQFQREIEQRDRELQTLRQQLANQGASKEVQQAVKDFKYDPEGEVSWEQQLSEFVKATVTNMHSEQQQRVRQTQEESAQREFHQKF